MAKKNSTKAVAKATKTPKAKKTAAVETAEVTEIEVVPTPTEEVVIDAKADITETEPKVHTCNTCGSTDELNAKGEPNFSMLKTGKLRPMCKSCQTAKSIGWTTEKAEYRKAYSRANFFLTRGIPAIVPTAKTWNEGDPIMTLEYGLLDGKIVSPDTEGATVVPSVNAEDVYAAQVAEAKAARDAKHAEQTAIAEAAKAERKRVRDEARAKRQAENDAEKTRKDAEREATRKQNALDKAAKAEQDRLDREAAKAEKTRKKAADAAAALVTKQLEQAEAKRLKDLEKATKAVDKTAEIDASNQKALDALKKTPATV
jgi:hypothetical protein